MSNIREIVVHLPKDLECFLDAQVLFLSRIGYTNPYSLIISSVIRLLNELAELNDQGYAVIVDGITGIPGFSVEMVRERILGASFKNVYLIKLEEEEALVLNDTRRKTGCSTDEEVIICSIAYFEWLVHVVRVHGNILVRCSVDGDIQDVAYHIPLLDAYKARLLH